MIIKQQLHNRHENAFDLLRLILAGGVIVSHAYLLGGYSGKDFLDTLSKGQTSLADISVMGFFVLSGYLITSSFQRAGNIGSFISHRLLRIYPGYWVCIIITGFGFAAMIGLLSNGNTGSFTFGGSNSSLSYFFNNFFIKINQWSVGNVLNKAAYNGSLNGSLWSLYPELQCYLLTLILGYFGLFNKNKAVVVLLFALVLLVFVARECFQYNTGPTFLYLSNALKLYASYLSGTVLFLYHDRISSDKKLLMFTAGCALLLIKFGGFNLLSPVLLGYILIYAFKAFSVKLRYDISYGIYIYGFPVQQMLFAYFHNRLPIVVFVLISLAITAAMGLLSFITVERYFIRLRKPFDNYLDKLYRRYTAKKSGNA